MIRRFVATGVLGGLLSLGGCPAAGDGFADAGDDDAGAGDDDTSSDDDDSTEGDDDTSDECAAAEPCDGTLVVDFETELEIVAGCESFTGDLEFKSDAKWLPEVDLPCLTAVGGDLTFHENPVLTRVELPALATVGGDVSVYDPAASMTHIGMPSLVTVGGSLYVEPAGSLATLDLSSLQSVGDMLKIYETDTLIDLDTPALTSVRQLAVRDNLTLEDVGGLSSITALDHLYLDNNAALGSLAALANLTEVDGEFYILNHACLDPAEVEAFVAGLVISGPITVEDNGSGFPCN